MSEDKVARQQYISRLSAFASLPVRLAAGLLSTHLTRRSMPGSVVKPSGLQTVQRNLVKIREIRQAQIYGYEQGGTQLVRSKVLLLLGLLLSAPKIYVISRSIT